MNVGCFIYEFVQLCFRLDVVCV